jgi:hypothetical protein
MHMFMFFKSINYSLQQNHIVFINTFTLSVFKCINPITLNYLRFKSNVLTLYFGIFCKKKKGHQYVSHLYVYNELMMRLLLFNNCPTAVDHILLPISCNGLAISQRVINTRPSDHVTGKHIRSKVV